MSGLISREAAIGAINALHEKSNAWLDSAVDAVMALLSAQPDRKKGKWKYETMRHIMTGEMRTVRICSECGGGWFRYDLSDGVEAAEPNYCPNCGADMRGEEG